MTEKCAPASLSPATRGSAVYDQMKRHEIQVLRRAGFPLREVARRAEVSLDTVLRVLQESGTPERVPNRVGRPPVAMAFEPHARKVLEERPDLPTVEIFRLLREQGYAGSKTPLYRLVRGLRKTVVSPMVRFSGLCGEFSQNDFGQVRVKYDDGTE